jgi:chorismate mutase/prephenate dehydratase
MSESVGGDERLRDERFLEREAAPSAVPRTTHHRSLARRMDIQTLRDQIDTLDREIISRLNRRADLARQIGALKAEKQAATFAPAREEEVLARARDANAGPLSNAAVEAVYREIISACRALERPLSIAYWGPPGSNTHLAAMARFGRQSHLVPVDGVAAVFSDVERDASDYGVVPVENSTEGIVTWTFDRFLDSSLRICAELYVPIRHHLLSRAESLDQVTRIYTMPQATGQCRLWLDRHAARIERIEVTNTARGAERAAAEPGTAAIANSVAAEIYGLNLLAEGIEDSPHNRTRFLVLGRAPTPPTGRDKTSLLFSVRHEAGELIRALAAFEKYDLNLTLIESRPTKQNPGEYVFFVDLLGHVDDPANPAVRRALDLFRQRTLFVKILGSYPEAS